MDVRLTKEPGPGERIICSTCKVEERGCEYGLKGGGSGTKDAVGLMKSSERITVFRFYKTMNTSDHYPKARLTSGQGEEGLSRIG